MNAMNKKRGLAGIFRQSCSWVWRFCLGCPCSDEMDVQQSYPFKVENDACSPRIVKGETVEIRCELKREGHFFRCPLHHPIFPAGRQGVRSRMDDGMVLLPNDRYPLTGRCSGCTKTSECETSRRLTSILRTTANRNSFTN